MPWRNPYEFRRLPTCPGCGSELVGRYVRADETQGVMRNTNSRRGQTSITHLMSFALPPRPQDHRSTFVRGTGRASTFGIGSGHHSSDKARYIHANYRFIVKPDGDYKRQAINADQHLDWNDVLQILASSVSQEASCPICLSHPVAPRMAKVCRGDSIVPSGIAPPTWQRNTC